jgi:hypothetical protein
MLGKKRSRIDMILEQLGNMLGKVAAALLQNRW